MGIEVTLEMVEWVVTKAFSEYDNAVPFEESVGFMTWYEKLILRVGDENSFTSCNFFPVAEGRVIWKSEFT
jgi:hypothetical protein